MVNQLFDEFTGKTIENDSGILWNAHQTRTIDLQVMMTNDEDSRNTRLSDVPNSTILSVIREKKGAKGDNIGHKIN